jgi:hypothetical protein
VAAFVRDICVKDLVQEVPIDDIFAAWKASAETNGNRPGSVQRFGRDLRTVVPSIRVVQPREEDGRQVRLYGGIGLRTELDTHGHAHRTDPDGGAPGQSESMTRNDETRVSARVNRADEGPDTHRYAHRTNVATGPTHIDDDYPPWASEVD